MYGFHLVALLSKRMMVAIKVLAKEDNLTHFLSASLYVSNLVKEALIEIGCVVTSLVVGCHARALWPNGAS